MKKYVYEIPAILPLEEVGLGGYGFHVYLDSDLAMKARREIMKPLAYNQFKKEGIKIIQSFFDKKYKGMPYQFAEESWLVHAICIPYGDACDLALGQYFLERFFGSNWEKTNKENLKPIWVDYVPHNVDNIKQAQCLRELFLNWANVTNICLNSD
jgi:hypothetical protein